MTIRPGNCIFLKRVLFHTPDDRTVPVGRRRVISSMSPCADKTTVHTVCSKFIAANGLGLCPFVVVLEMKLLIQLNICSATTACLIEHNYTENYHQQVEFVCFHNHIFPCIHLRRSLQFSTFHKTLYKIVSIGLSRGNSHVNKLIIINFKVCYLFPLFPVRNHKIVWGHRWSL